MGSPAVRPSNHIARNASWIDLKLQIELECQVCLEDRQIHTKCFLTKKHGLDILGLDWMAELGLLKRIINTIADEQMPSSIANLANKAEKKSVVGRNRQKDQPKTLIRIEAQSKAVFEPINTKNDIIKGYPFVFQDSPDRCKKMKAQLFLKQNVEPVFRPKRPVPFSALHYVTE